MIESLALISGKGGSGKTTLAISIAQLLATCGKRVLLVDCDLSTHGATYFFEGMLSSKDKHLTFIDLMVGDFGKKKILQVDPNIGFIPSCVDFPSKKAINRFNMMGNNNYSSESSLSLEKILVILEDVLVEESKYDIIIYDCQAGYSIATEKVTKLAKKILVVTEVDAISASSLRVLYSQLSEQLENSKSYQVFNKVTEVEQEIYSKLTHETLFTNITPILFDWNVRKAFVTNELPCIGTANPILTMSVYNLASALFQQYKNDFLSFIIDFKGKKLSDFDNEIIDNKPKQIKKLGIYISSIVFFAYGLLVLLSDFDFFSAITPAIVLGITATVILITAEHSVSQKTRLSLHKERDKLIDEINELKKKANNVSKSFTINLNELNDNKESEKTKEKALI